jgi:hypothetical protein
MAGKRITRKALIKVLKLERRQRPGTVTDALHCLYFSAEDMVTPICLIGCAMAANGWTLRDIPGSNGERIGMIDKADEIFTVKALALAMAVQDEQDSQVPWGDAVTRVLAEDAVNRMGD